MSAQPSEAFIDSTGEPLGVRVGHSPMDSAGAKSAARVLDFLAAHEAKQGPASSQTFYLAGVEADDRIELPNGMHQLLKDIVEAMSKGEVVSILSNAEEITTQQAAEILGLSRPTVVSLIDKGELAATVPGSRRRKLRLVDVLEYRESLHARRNRFIEQSAAAYEFTDGEELLDVADALAEARRSAQP